MTTTPTTDATTTPPPADPIVDAAVADIERRLNLAGALRVLRNTVSSTAGLVADLTEGALRPKATPESLLALYDTASSRAAKRKLAHQHFQIHAGFHEIISKEVFGLGVGISTAIAMLEEALGADVALADDVPPAGDGASNYRAAADALAATIDPPTDDDPDRYRAAGECLAAATVQAAATIGETAGTA